MINDEIGEIPQKTRKVSDVVYEGYPKSKDVLDEIYHGNPISAVNSKTGTGINLLYRVPKNYYFYLVYAHTYSTLPGNYDDGIILGPPLGDVMLLGLQDVQNKEVSFGFPLRFDENNAFHVTSTDVITTYAVIFGYLIPKIIV